MSIGAKPAAEDSSGGQGRGDAHKRPDAGLGAQQAGGGQDPTGRGTRPAAAV